MGRIFAIGDIHGCSQTLKKLIFEKLFLTKNDILYFIGDYIDRGPDSKGVIDCILGLQSDGFKVFPLRGNHEQMMLDSLYDKHAMKLWMDNGGKTTLRSFGINSLEEIDEKYWSFFHDTMLCFNTENYIFVHAGLNFKRKNILEDKEAMLWIRDFAPEQPALEHKIMIHGHTPIELDQVLIQTTNCINIDAGCVYKNRSQMGNLVAIELPSRSFIWQRNCD
ncbi:MAG TPA: metallophosphoesterase family protein [Hanamia sp.]